MGFNTLSNLYALLLKHCYLYHCFDYYHYLIFGFFDYLLHLLVLLYFFLCLVRDDTVISSTSLMSKIY